MRWLKKRRKRDWLKQRGGELGSLGLHESESLSRSDIDIMYMNLVLIIPVIHQNDYS